MATRWKTIIKVTAFLVLIASFSVATLGFLQMAPNARALVSSSFEEYDSTLHSTYYELSEIIEMQSEEFISSGEYQRYIHTAKELNNMSDREKEQEIRRQLYSYRSAIKSLGELENIYYYASYGEQVIANIEWPEVLDWNAFICYDGETIRSSGGYYPMDTKADRIFVAYNNGYAEWRQMAFKTERANAYNQLQRVLLMVLPGILALLCLIWLAGGSFKIDKLWNEVILGLIALDVGTFGSFCVAVMKSGGNVFLNIAPWIFLMISGAFCLVGTALLLMLVRNIKNGRLIKGTLIYQTCAWAWRILKEIMQLTPLNLKLGGVVLGGMIVTAITGAILAQNGDVMSLILLVVEAIVVLWVVLKHIIRPYDEEVEARLRLEVDAKMKSERLKTELVTNVSHDLKTPLTAILNYSDLLLKRDPKDEYAKIINEKGQTLRSLTEDLFEISKAQSGNMNVKLEALDLTELIDQTLAELDENDVDFKINIKARAIVADGALMARVFGNLAGNIVKYSLTGTRAYIDSIEDNGKTVITFKNIANYPMNFDSDEIAERFKRGDTSRATEGNGLGLAIAKSYTEACGGRFDIEVDGDLFKVTIVI